MTGCALVWGVPMTEMNGAGYRTTFARGAFAASIATLKSASRIEAWVNHSRNSLLALRRDGDLGLAETAEGLMFVMHVDHPIWSSTLTKCAMSRQLHGVSIAWGPDVHARWDGDDRRVITAADLLEVSLVLFDMRPKCPGTWARVTARAA